VTSWRHVKPHAYGTGFFVFFFVDLRKNMQIEPAVVSLVAAHHRVLLALEIAHDKDLDRI
jgi:hypothetical protein